MKKLLILAALSNAAFAGWTETERANDGSFYTSVDATNIQANSFVVYADPDEDCRPTLMVLELQARSGLPEVKDAPMRVEMKVDSEEKWVNDNARYQLGYDWETEYSEFRIWQRGDYDFLTELAQGKELILRAKPRGGDWSPTVRYSLEGSSAALTQTVRACVDARKWSDV